MRNENLLIFLVNLSPWELVADIVAIFSFLIVYTAVDLNVRSGSVPTPITETPPVSAACCIVDLVEQVPHQLQALQCCPQYYVDLGDLTSRRLLFYNQSPSARFL